MTTTKLCINCNLPVRGLEAEGDRPICLTCLQSLTPHCSFDGGYYSPDSIIKMGKILQTEADNKIVRVRKKPKDKQ